MVRLPQYQVSKLIQYVCKCYCPRKKQSYCTGPQSEMRAKIVAQSNFHFLAWIDRGFIPLHKNLLYNFRTLYQSYG